MRYFLLLLSLFLLPGLMNAGALEDTFARMDALAGKFKGLTADLKQVSRTHAGNQDLMDEATGTIKVKRSSRTDLKILMQLQAPNEKTASFAGNKATIFYPKRKEAEEYPLGKAGLIKDQLMMVAFGSTSRDLMNGYTVAVGGTETVAGQQTTRLVLTPKNAEMARQFPTIEEWIANQGGYTVQQKFNQGGGDYLLNTYTNIKLGDLSDSDVKLVLPKGTSITHPLK